MTTAQILEAIENTAYPGGKRRGPVQQAMVKHHNQQIAKQRWIDRELSRYG